MTTVQANRQERSGMTRPDGEATGRGTPRGDALVVDVGGAIGALAIHAPAHRSGDEIDISPCHRDHDRTHNVIRPRRAGNVTRFVAVFPSLPAGEYTVWRDAVTPAGTVTVRGGQVATFHLR